MENIMKSFSQAIEEKIANFPTDEREVFLKNDKVEIQILRTEENTYSIRVYGIEIARKAENLPIEYIDTNFNIVMQRVARENPEGIGGQEIDNPDALDMAYLNLEDSTETKRRIEEEQTPNTQKTPEEKEQEEKEQEKKEEETKTEESSQGNNAKKENVTNKKQTGIDTKTNILLNQQIEKQKLDEKKAKEKQEDRVEMNLTRENSSDEALKQFIYRTMKVNPQRVVRVRTGSHTYKYEIYDHKGIDVGEKLLTPKIGGHDPRMKIWTLDNNGHYVKKEVDSLLLTQNGRYGFATDRGNNALSDVTTSYTVTRLPGGEYIAVRALEQQKRNREASNLEAVKDATASKKSDHEMKEQIEAAKTAKNIEAVKEDGVIDTKEVEITALLKKEGFKKEEIDQIFKDIYEGTVIAGMTCSEVEKTVCTVKDLKEQGCSIDRIKEILEENKYNLREIPEEGENTQRTRGGDALERREHRV